MKDNPISTCPECASPVKRLLYPVGVVFKGSGWYINDSRKPEKSEAQDSGDSTSKETKSTDSKADMGTSTETAKTISSDPKSSD